MYPRLLTTPLFTLHTFGLLLAAAYIAAYWYLMRQGRREGLDIDALGSLGIWAIVGIPVRQGGKLYNSAVVIDSDGKVRERYSGLILGGIDEVNYRKLTAADLKRQWGEAAKAAGKKFILTPGCSVPNDSSDEELSRLPKILGA